MRGDPTEQRCRPQRCNRRRGQVAEFEAGVPLTGRLTMPTADAVTPMRGEPRSCGLRRLRK